MQTVTLHTWQTYFPLPLKAMVKRQPNFTPKSRRCLFSHPTTRAAESWGKKRFSFSQNWNKSHWTLVISCCPPPACESSSKHYFWCVKLRGFLQLYGYTASPLLTHSWKLPLSKQDFNFLTSQSCFWSPPKPSESSQHVLRCATAHQKVLGLFAGIHKPLHLCLQCLLFLALAEDRG